MFWNILLIVFRELSVNFSFFGFIFIIVRFIYLRNRQLLSVKRVFLHIIFYILPLCLFVLVWFLAFLHVDYL